MGLVTEDPKQAVGKGFIANARPKTATGFMDKITPELIIKVLMTPPPPGSTLEKIFGAVEGVKDQAVPSGGGKGSVIGQVNKKTGKRTVYRPGGTMEI